MNGTVNKSQMTMPVDPADKSPQTQLLNLLEVEPISAPDLPPALLDRYQKTQDLATQADLPLQFLGYQPVFSDTKIYHGPNTDWVMMNLTQDPLFQAQGQKLYAPAQARQDLMNLVAAGLVFDAIFIAHEIPPGSVLPDDQVPLAALMPPLPHQTAQNLAFLDRSQQGFWHGIAKGTALALALPVLAAGALAVAAGAVVLGAAAMAISAVGLVVLAVGAPVIVGMNFDPVILGVQFDPDAQDQSPALWYHLTNWHW